MKNYKFFVCGVFCFIFFLMVLINLPAFIISPIVFLINVGIISVSALIVYFLAKNYESYIKNSANAVRRFLSSESYQLIDDLPIPTAIVSEKNPEKIIFYNKDFAKEFCAPALYFRQHLRVCRSSGQGAFSRRQGAGQRHVRLHLSGLLRRRDSLRAAAAGALPGAGLARLRRLYLRGADGVQRLRRRSAQHVPAAAGAS